MLLTREAFFDITPVELVGDAWRTVKYVKTFNLARKPFLERLIQTVDPLH